MRIQCLSNFALALACALALVTTRAAALDMGPVNINTASEKELEALPGVGEATAKKIVAGRPYSSVDDLAKAGVSKTTIGKLRSSVTVGGAATAPAASSKAASSKASAAPAAKAAGPVDLNTASLKDLEELPGVGEATAKKIVAGRPYASVDDLAKAGVSKSTIEKLRSGATVSGAAAVRAPATAPTSTPAPASAPAPAAAAPASAAAAPARPVTSATSGTAAGEPGKVAPGEKVNINTASKEELERLPGIGPTKAQAIIDARPFASPTDIMKVKGIKEGTFGKLKDNITVN